jgi:hypothetical protein
LTEDWPWWIGLGLMSPLAILFLLDDGVEDVFSGDWGDNGVGGDFGGGGAGDGGS